MWAAETINSESWPKVHALLAPALAVGDDGTTEELIDELLGHLAQLWVLRGKGGDPIAAAVSELVPTPSGRLVHVRLVGGKNMPNWLDDAVATISAHAREVGATAITINGRKEWERVLGRRGWKPRSVILERSIGCPDGR